MIDLREVNQEIKRLENGNTNYPNCEKLSQLYIVREHISRNERDYAPEYSTAAVPVSDFLEATEGVPMNHILNVLDEHMEAIRVMYPREYRSIINRIKNP